jgi:hypothetical protein
VTSGAESIIPPLEYFTNVMDLTLEQAESIVAAAKANKDQQMTIDATQQNGGQLPPTPKQPANPGTGAAA